jgi:hypothetical protein
MKRRGIIALTYERLAKLLRLPTGARVIGTANVDGRDTLLVRLADHEGLPEVAEGEHIPMVGEPAWVVGQKEDVFVGWTR